MGLIIPPGYLHAVYEFSYVGDSEAMVTTCGHELDTASGANGPDSADDLMTAFGTEVMPLLGADLTLTGVTTYVGQDASGSLVYTSSGAGIVGGQASTLLPPNSAYLVRKRTDLAGKRGRGRMYLPAVPESSVDNNGMLNPTTLSVGQGFLDDWYAFLTAGAGARLYPPVVLHRSEGIGTEPLPTPITTFVLEPQIATQRRRLRP